MRVNGTVYYYDALQSNAELACEIDPPTNTRCSIPVRDTTGNLNKICILAERESSSSAFEFSEFEYYMASFDDVQVILITLICVGLVSFVCMCGLSISLCTKPGRRLRQALHMSSPLSNYYHHSYCVSMFCLCFSLLYYSVYILYQNEIFLYLYIIMIGV